MGLDSLLEQYALGQCTRLKTETIETILNTLTENENILNSYKDKLYRLYARFYSLQGRFAEAIDMADKSLSISPNSKHFQFQRIIWLQREKRYAEALEEIAKIRANLNLFSDVVYLEDLKRGEKIIRELMESTTKSTTN